MMLMRFVALVLLAIGVSLGIAHAQIPGVAQELIARGRTDHSDEVGGPADVSVASIKMEPGSRYGDWHTHPGPVWVIVTAGALAVYGPDNCRTEYRAGSAYLAQADTAYDIRNESDSETDLIVSGVTRVGEAGTQPTSPPATACAR